MTVCNMSIEAGARAGMIAPDETTFAYLAGRPRAPAGRGLGTGAGRAGASCPSDPGARFDRELDVDANDIEPMITYGTNPGMVRADRRRDSRRRGDAAVRARRSPTWASRPASRCTDQPVNVVFIGSCTNWHALGPAQRGRAAARAARSRAGVHHAGRARLAGGQARRPRRKGSTACSSMPAPSGASRAARCASA